MFFAHIRACGIGAIKYSSRVTSLVLISLNLSTLLKTRKGVLKINEKHMHGMNQYTHTPHSLVSKMNSEGPVR